MRFNLLGLWLILLAACAPATPPSPAANQFCQTRTEGRWVKNANGNTIALHGANLPTLTEMAASGKPGIAQMRDLAAQGVTLVRLRVSDKEVSPTFIPLQVMPFVQAANAQGVIVILAWDMVINEINNVQIDATEEWIRQLLVYIGREPGVWIDPINEIRSIPLARRRTLAQRYIDIMRGYRLQNIVVINEPLWLLDSNPTINQPLSGENVVYGIRKLDQPSKWPLEQYPFMLTEWDGERYDVASNKVGSASGVGVGRAVAQAQWKLTDKVCR